MKTPPEAIAAANRLAEISRIMPPEFVANEVRKVMREHYIRGGIAALESVIDSVPAKALELSPERREMVAAMITIIETFIEQLKEKV